MAGPGFAIHIPLECGRKFVMGSVHACMQEGKSGVLVTHISATSCCVGLLQPQDVLMKIGSCKVRQNPFSESDICASGSHIFQCTAQWLRTLLRFEFVA